MSGTRTVTRGSRGRFAGSGGGKTETVRVGRHSTAKASTGTKVKKVKPRGDRSTPIKAAKNSSTKGRLKFARNLAVGGLVGAGVGYGISKGITKTFPPAPRATLRGPLIGLALPASSSFMNKSGNLRLGGSGRKLSGGIH